MEEEKTENSVENREYNDIKTGRFVEGNPGKPKGIKHMSTLLEEAIKKVAEDTGTSEDKAIVKKVIELAKKGDMKAIEHIWDRLEGKATQPIEHSGSIDINPEDQEKIEKAIDQVI